MFLFLTFLGFAVLLLNKMVILVGEVMVLIAYFTCSQRNVAKTREFCEKVAAFVLIGLDNQ
jgi:hypothetical protein